MKNLTKARIKEFVEMTDREMKFTVGGSGSDSGGSGSGSGSSNCDCYVNMAGTACEKTCCAPVWENNKLVSKSCKFYAAIPSAGMAAFCSCG